MTKSTYRDATNKKEVRDYLFSHFNLHKIVGLAGPDIKEYITYLKNRQYREIEIWENNLLVTGVQLPNIKEPITYKVGNISTSEYRKDILFDLDYCCTINSVRDYLKKFEDNFIMTFSRRGLTDEKVINIFFKERKEKIRSEKSSLSPIRHFTYKTDKGIYLYVPYFDTSPMCSISKIK